MSTNRKPEELLQRVDPKQNQLINLAHKVLHKVMKRDTLKNEFTPVVISDAIFKIIIET